MVDYTNVSEKQLIERINNLKAERERTADCLKELEAELGKRKNKALLGVPFIPKNEEEYWLIESRGFPFFTRNKDSFDVAAIKFLNSFRSKESAEKHIEMLLDWRKALVANASGQPIDIKVLLPLFEKGWIAMDESGNWFWYRNKPDRKEGFWNVEDTTLKSLYCFNLKPAKDWSKSLMECGL